MVNLTAPTLSQDEVAERISDLRQAWSTSFRDRVRIRQIMNGGTEAILALMGPKAAAKLGAEDLPVVNMFDAGITKLARRLGRAPDVKVDPRADKDTKTERNRAQKRENILAGLDYQTRIRTTLPLAGRWLPGYSFQPWLIQNGVGRNGEKYAKAEIRNPFDCFPGQWGPDQQPEEMAFIRVASKRRLARQYPMYAAHLESKRLGGSTMLPYTGTGAAGIWSPGRTAWEGPSASDAVLLGEYMDSSGTYLMAMDDNILLDFVPNPLAGPAFALAKRPSFDKPKGQYDHYVGVMSMMAKLNILAYFGVEDAVFRETNIVGELVGDEYRRGRRATNFFAPGTTINKPGADVPFQVFNQIDRIERQLRIGTNYSVVEDSESPNSFATGRALDRLTDSGTENVREYQDQMQFALEVIDSKRLEWEYNMWPGLRKTIEANVRGQQISESYVPRKDIAGQFGSRRVYGVMAGYDDAEVIVTGLQLIHGDIIDVQTMQENMDGLENIPRINRRIRQRKTEDRLYDVLTERASQGDPRAEMALAEIYVDPDNIEEILRTFYTPDEPEMTEEQAAMAAAGAAGGAGGSVVPPESVSTVLTRLMAGGQADAGVQTVGRLAG